jgi:isoleucyl-tRNA synthetase
MLDNWFVCQLQVVNRIQKLRKKTGLEPTDAVEVYFESLDEDKSISQQVLNSQVMLTYNPSSLCALFFTY